MDRRTKYPMFVWQNGRTDGIPHVFAYNMWGFWSGDGLLHVCGVKCADRPNTPCGVICADGPPMWGKCADGPNTPCLWGKCADGPNTPCLWGKMCRRTKYPMFFLIIWKDGIPHGVFGPQTEYHMGFLVRGRNTPRPSIYSIKIVRLRRFFVGWFSPAPYFSLVGLDLSI